MTRTADRSARAPIQLMVAAAAIGLAFAVIAPLRTAQASFELRLIYWLPLHLIAWPILTFVLSRVDASGLEDAASRAIFRILSVFLFSLPFTVIVLFWSSTIFGLAFEVARLPNLYRNVVPISGLIMSLEVLRLSAQSFHEAPPDDGPSEFLRRLPLRLRHGEIISLQAQDHYVQVVTSKGVATIHARFCDVMKEFQYLDGRRVHRSWWVANNAIKYVRRQKGKTSLVLEDGRSIPVSRSFARSFRYL